MLRLLKQSFGNSCRAMPQYTVVLAREEDGRFSVSVPALPGCHTWGDTYEDAVAMAKDAIDLYLDELRARNEPAPTQTEVIVTSVAAA